MSQPDHAHTGTVPTPHGQLAYRRINQGAGTPVLVIHGGPGAGYRYMRRLEMLAPQREIVFYDQLGCGDSTAPDDAALWVIERFADEIRLVRDHLGLDEVQLVAHSSGGWFGLEYLATQPAGVRAMVLANTTASMEQFRTSVARRIEELPESHRAVIARFAHDPWSLDDEYCDALRQFYVRHLVQRTDQAAKLLELQRDSAVYQTMMGPHELAVVGNLASWDRRADLAAMAVPTLVIAGGRDHILPDAARDLWQRLPAADFVLLAHCGHDPLNEATDETLTAIANFLGDNE